jgi:hypothetical protein
MLGIAMVLANHPRRLLHAKTTLARRSHFNTTSPPRSAPRSHRPMLAAEIPQRVKFRAATIKIPVGRLVRSALHSVMRLALTSRCWVGTGSPDPAVSVGLLHQFLSALPTLIGASAIVPCLNAGFARAGRMISGSQSPSSQLTKAQTIRAVLLVSAPWHERDPRCQIPPGLADRGICNAGRKDTGQHRPDHLEPRSVRRRPLLAQALAITSCPLHWASLRRGNTTLYIKRRFGERPLTWRICHTTRASPASGLADRGTDDDRATASVSGVVGLIAAIPGS